MLINSIENHMKKKNLENVNISLVEPFLIATLGFWLLLDTVLFIGSTKNSLFFSFQFKDLKK